MGPPCDLFRLIFLVLMNCNVHAGSKYLNKRALALRSPIIEESIRTNQTALGKGNASRLISDITGMGMLDHRRSHVIDSLWFSFFSASTQRQSPSINKLYL